MHPITPHVPGRMEAHPIGTLPLEQLEPGVADIIFSHLSLDELDNVKLAGFNPGPTTYTQRLARMHRSVRQGITPALTCRRRIVDLRDTPGDDALRTQVAQTLLSSPLRTQDDIIQARILRDDVASPEQEYRLTEALCLHVGASDDLDAARNLLDRLPIDCEERASLALTLLKKGGTDADIQAARAARDSGSYTLVKAELTGVVIKMTSDTADVHAARALRDNPHYTEVDRFRVAVDLWNMLRDPHDEQAVFAILRDPRFTSSTTRITNMLFENNSATAHETLRMLCDSASTDANVRAVFSIALLEHEFTQHDVGLARALRDDRRIRSYNRSNLALRLIDKTGASEDLHAARRLRDDLELHPACRSQLAGALLDHHAPQADIVAAREFRADTAIELPYRMRVAKALLERVGDYVDAAPANGLINTPARAGMQFYGLNNSLDRWELAAALLDKFPSPEILSIARAIYDRSTEARILGIRLIAHDDPNITKARLLQARSHHPRDLRTLMLQETLACKYSADLAQSKSQLHPPYTWYRRKKRAGNVVEDSTTGSD